MIHLRYPFLAFVLCGAIASLHAANSTTEAEAKAHSAVTPQLRTDVSWYMPRHEQKLQQAAQQEVDLLFIGDSITHYWENQGRTVWQEYYANRKAFNLGFSGDKTSNVLWRLQNGEVDQLSPKLTVIMIGTNNRESATQIADGVKAICAEVRQRMPESKILVLGIFPRGDYRDRPKQEVTESGDNRQWATNREANTILSQFADNETIFYLDIGEAFLNEGKVRRDLMPDFLHPNTAGYQVWAEAQEPALKKLLGES